MNRDKHMRVICLFFFAVIIPFFGFAQLSPPQDSVTTTKKSSFTSVFHGQPGRAALYSLIIPGAGQLYNRRYWKAPLIWAGEGYALYNLIDKLNAFNDIDACYQSLIDGPAVCDGLSISEAFNARQSARSNKEFAWLIFGIAHLLNAVEAFVDRHLINFDTSEQLSLQHPVYHVDPMPSITLLRFSIPLNGR